VISRSLLALLCATSIAAAAATPEPVAVVLDRDSRAYGQAVTSIERAGHRVTRLKADDPQLAARLRALPPGSSCLAFGPRSAKLLERETRCARAALFVQSREAPAGMPAVTLEVPHTRQLGWLHQAFPGRRHLIVLRQPGASNIDDEELRAAATAAGFELVLAAVRSSGDAVPVLEAALRGRHRSAVVWLLPDPVAISTSTVAPLTQTALAARVPVVGFSEYFLRVGAIAAVAVDYGACGTQALALARAGGGHVAPAAARLVVEGRLAERLGIAVSEGPGVEIRR
jgi:hypothetical protein